MRVKGKSIRTLTKVLPHIGDGRIFHIGVPVSGNENRLNQAGFPEKVEGGHSLLPSVMGRHTNFNVNGREVVRPDLPLINESKMVYSTWNDWHGYSHSGFQHRTYKVRQRDLIDPPGEHLTIVAGSDGLHVVSRELSTSTDTDDQILHVFNLFLECFGTFQILDRGKAPIIKVNRLNWRVLPKGQYPWDVAKAHVEQITSRLKESDREVIEHRLKAITRHSPDFLAVGQGGFDGYFVLGFSEKNLHVLESLHLDNATYVFDSNWQELSKLTKKEILSGGLHRQRLIHNAAWYRGVSALLAAKKVNH